MERRQFSSLSPAPQPHGICCARVALRFRILINSLIRSRRRWAAKLSCAALAVSKRFQSHPQISSLSVTQLDGYRYQLALNSGR